MPSQVLAAGTTAASSSDITVTSYTTVALFRPIDDNLILEEDPDADLLLEDGSILLLEEQGGDSIAISDYLEIKIKDPNGAYNPTGIFLKSHQPAMILGPGVWRVDRPVTTTPIGVQTDAAS